MSRTWLTNPPYPAWKDYAPWLNTYEQLRITLPEHQLPAGMRFLDWFREHHSALRSYSALRDCNTFIAVHLLPIFEADPTAWETVTLLNRESLQMSTNRLPSTIAKWRSRCPENLRPFVRRLAAEFAIAL